MHIPLLIQSVSPASTQLATALIKAKIFEPDEIQFFSQSVTLFTQDTFTKHAMGLSRETSEQLIDSNLRRYCHFSNHKIVQVIEKENLLYAQESDKPLQAFTYEKLWLDQAISSPAN